MTQIGELTSTELLRHFRNKTLSPVEVARDVLARIETQDAKVNAFCLRYEEETLAQARASEARWQARAPVGLLDGVPITIKDMLLQKGHPSRRGTLTAQAFPAAEDSPARRARFSSGARPCRNSPGKGSPTARSPASRATPGTQR